MKYLKIIGACGLLGLSVNTYAQCPASPLPAWDAVNASNGGTLTITDTGAAGTLCKMTVTQGPNNSGKATVRDDMDTAESRYRARFYIDASNMLSNNTAGNERVKIFTATNFDTTVGTGIDVNGRPALMQMFVVGQGGGNARLGGFCRDLNSDGNRARFGNGTNPGTVPLQAGFNVVEIEVLVGAGSGACRIWVNNNTEGSPNWEKTNVDNNLMVGVKRGNIGNIGATIPYATALGSLEMHFDEFESRRQTFIGSN